MSPVLALSTSCCSHRHTDGYAMLREIADLGFDYVELSHGIRITLVPGILKALEEGIIRPSSCHNFCPLPTGILQAAPNAFEPSSLDPKERDQWLRHTKRSLDFASQIGARVLVCHLGSARYLWFNPGRRLEAYLEKHPDAVTAGDPAYKALLAKSLGKLRSHSAPYWANTDAAIRSVLDYAKQKNILLGLENREGFVELPIDSDYASFLASLPSGSSAGYWHDVGHAHLKEGLGLLNHRQQLSDNQGRLIGFHLHDVTEKGDHQPIGTGKIDFQMVSEFFRPEHLFIIELGPRTTPEQIQASRESVKGLLRQRGLL